VPDAGRVITGTAGGLRLAAPGSGTRPLSDKVKQALFSMLEAERDDVWEWPLLDLFAGSGAAGIEALSRGAPAVLLVEQDARAVAVIRANLDRTGLSARARVLRRDVGSLLDEPTTGVPEAPFGSAVIDPPYAQAADLWAGLERLGEPAHGWLDERVVVVAKHFWRDAPPESTGDLVRVRVRRFGETALSVYRRAEEPAAGGG
jgi:16S rRNA (guanine966-N2)-methyltransferase